MELREGGDFEGPRRQAAAAALPIPPTSAPVAGAPMTPGTPPATSGMNIPGFGGSQDLMRQIMMQILMPQLQKFMGGQQPGWGPVAGSQGQPAANPYPAGMGMPTMPNPAQWGQGPAGMNQGMMSWLAPFIFQNFFQNMGIGQQPGISW